MLATRQLKGNVLVRQLVVLIGLASIVVCARAADQPAPKTEQQHGELLYSTYCIGCHTTEVHWREKRLATDWPTLKNQVRRWQNNIGLALGEDDVAAIAGYLNGLYYHFPATGPKQSGVVDSQRTVAQNR
jgi:mono/diheme cytochrome c family protein